MFDIKSEIDRVTDEYLKDNKIDEIKALRHACYNLIGQLSVAYKPVHEDKTKAYLEKEYGVKL